VIIAVILGASVALSFGNELRAEQDARALHSRLRQTCLVRRGGTVEQVDVAALVPGDVVELAMGQIVPADLRLLASAALECDESVLTGESLPVAKTSDPVSVPAGVVTSPSSGLMGTGVHSGCGSGVVVATGTRTAFGRIAAALGEHEPETEFQVGLRRFSMLLVTVGAVLTAGIFVVNLALRRPLIDALLFSLAIAIGISPQLLPAVVSTSLAAGSRRLARSKVLIKRLVCIEALGDVDVLFTDKTGTLTEGRLSFMRSVGPDGALTDAPALLGLLCTDFVVDPDGANLANPLDVALWAAPSTASLHARTVSVRRLATLPFDHERRMVSVLVEDETGRRIVTKGAPETVLDRCTEVPPQLRQVLQAEFAAGHRVVAVASRDVPGQGALRAGDERDLRPSGLLVFLDPPKPTAARALQKLDRLGVTVKLLTGDNADVATRVCADLGLAVAGVRQGSDLDGLDDDELTAVIACTTVFARVSPELKARLVRAQRRTGGAVAFLGDGVNDAAALHAADVGVSVDTATDVAKDAADAILLEKDLGVLADGVVEGRRTFANTMKYVLMGTSSNFGNMFSAAAASAFLAFLPMLPSQILLNNLLYDTSQLSIPTDHVDPEQLARPSRWDVAFIRRFMLVFGPISSLFDFATFAVMLGVFHAGPSLFRSGWFVESLATQTLVIFVIRTRRVPFFRSTPSVPLLLAALGVVAVGVALPATPLAPALGFTPLPAEFLVALAVMTAVYLLLIEAVKIRFFRAPSPSPVPRPRPAEHHLHRRAARFRSASGAAAPSPPRPGSATAPASTRSRR
jgi:Mg2+-importing ATPase